MGIYICDDCHDRAWRNLRQELNEYIKELDLEIKDKVDGPVKKEMERISLKLKSNGFWAP